MPNIKSVKKDVKRSAQRRLRNQAAKSQIKTVTKKARTLIDAGAAADAAQTVAAVHAAESMIDRCVKRGIIHKNAAARRKSRLMKAQNAASAAAAA